MSAAVDDALKRLQVAIGALEVTIARRLDVEHRRGDLETELQLMQDDRARLAVELESTSARLNRVETATDHVERRVHNAIGTIRDVLSRAETSPREV
ncbi:MAG TPA: DUF4164 domain-containing protein [Enterovirga sp.]|jgi:predicted  nucleic acid-binding Zn-ribbon protein|nr:DUF4164 domain-containing protein [Enterovirga sp.]